MKRTGTYFIDEERYKSTDNHNLLLETTQYIVGDDILTKQIIHVQMQKKLSPFLSRLGFESPRTFYFTQKWDYENKTLISKTAFEKKLSRSRIAAQPSLYETIEELTYTNSSGRADTLVIAITQKEEGIRKAEIEFESGEQEAYFVAPD